MIGQPIPHGRHCTVNAVENVVLNPNYKVDVLTSTFSIFFINLIYAQQAFYHTIFVPMHMAAGTSF